MNRSVWDNDAIEMVLMSSNIFNEAHKIMDEIFGKWNERAMWGSAWIEINVDVSAENKCLLWLKINYIK